MCSEVKCLCKCTQCTLREWEYVMHWNAETCFPLNVALLMWLEEWFPSHWWWLWASGLPSAKWLADPATEKSTCPGERTGQDARNPALGSRNKRKVVSHKSAARSRSPVFPTALFSSSTLCCVRSLVDILRHQSSPGQQGERNNTTVLTTTSDGRMSKNLYTPILQSKDNRSKSTTPGKKKNHRKKYDRIKKKQMQRFAFF